MTLQSFAIVLYTYAYILKVKVDFKVTQSLHLFINEFDSPLKPEDVLHVKLILRSINKSLKENE